MRNLLGFLRFANSGRSLRVQAVGVKPSACPLPRGAAERLLVSQGSAVAQTWGQKGPWGTRA